jgi:parvulin-like peptidyl-prolyl isomerase
VRRLLREPLIHFLVGGGLLFALYAIVVEDPAYAPDRIVVDPARVASLSADFERTWMRPPSKIELDELIAEFVNEEVLYREALALGFDRDDPVIRRRMRQKMEFLYADLIEIEPPSEADLASFLTANRERFRQPARVSFRQVYVDPDVGPATPHDRARALLEALQAGEAEAGVAGDPTLLPRAMEMASASEVAAVFGSGFAEDLLGLSGDGWSGPVASSFGPHLVRIDARKPTRDPELDEVRQQVVHEYGTIERTKSNQQLLEKLREQYEIEIQASVTDTTARPSAQSE